jgi:hypothetical protein
MHKRRIIFLGKTDFANTMTKWAKAIRHHSRTTEAFSVCLRSHVFQYEDPHDLDLSDQTVEPHGRSSWADQVIPDRVAVAKHLLATADLIVQSDELAPHEVLKLFGQLTGLALMGLRNRVIVRHSGSHFRAEYIDRSQRDLSCRGQIVHPDLLRLAGNNASPAFAVVESTPSRRAIAARFSQSRLVIIHTPSRRSKKGSDIIRRVVEAVIRDLPERSIEYQEVGGVPNRIIRQRKGEAHIHIDQFNPNGRDGIGGLGGSSCEGWELGNVVLCSVNNIQSQAWQAWNVDPSRLPLIDIGTDESFFYERLHNLCCMPSIELSDLAVQQGQQAYRAFGPRKVTEYFENLVGHGSGPAQRPIVHHGDRRPVFVCGQWSSPAALHKYRYFSMLAEAFGARVLQVASEDQLAERLLQLRPSMVITANFPMYSVYSERWVHELPRSLPLVSWHDDLRREMNRHLPRILERSDAVISVLREAVLRPDQFPTIQDKLWRLPWFIPEQVAPFQLNGDPVLKCLMPGAIKNSRPLRRRAIKEINGRRLERLEHPGYGRSAYHGAIVGQAFYDFLHQFACVLTDGGVYRYTVAKYFEIPYTGALMLADPVPDLDELGFRAGQHFVAVEETTPLGPLVDDILSNFEQYRDIRAAGRDLIMQRHTEETRRQQAREMAAEMMDQFGLCPVPSNTNR